jgi:hypothetical protein
MSNGTTRTSERLSELMHRATPPHSLQEHLEGRARLIASVEKLRGGGGRAARVALTLGVAAAAAAGAVLVTRRSVPKPVAWHVEGATVEAQGYVSVPPASPAGRASDIPLDAHLVFDDGSEVSLAPGSRGRVEGTSPTGAEVVLEQGRAEVHVQHRDRTAWTIDAGPYSVHVTGTEFLVAWAADAETLDVWMRSGRVVVTGPLLEDELTLSAGKHLTASVRDRSSRIDGSPEPSSAALPVAPTVASPDPASSVTSGATPGMHEADMVPPASKSSPASASWSRRVAAGDYAGVVRDAESQGLNRVVSSRPLADLRALGDAARYAGRADVAKRAYETLRDRFPSTPEARTAAFLLGRVEEEQEHAIGEALRWYDTYFEEAPTGALAADALGRKMILVSRSQGRDAARSLAQRYLERFPSGTYSAAARDLTP